MPTWHTFRSRDHRDPTRPQIKSSRRATASSTWLNNSRQWWFSNRQILAICPKWAGKIPSNSNLYPNSNSSKRHSSKRQDRRTEWVHSSTRLERHQSNLCQESSFLRSKSERKVNWRIILSSIMPWLNTNDSHLSNRSILHSTITRLCIAWQVVGIWYRLPILPCWMKSANLRKKLRSSERQDLSENTGIKSKDRLLEMHHKIQIQISLFHLNISS